MSPTIRSIGNYIMNPTCHVCGQEIKDATIECLSLGLCTGCWYFRKSRSDDYGMSKKATTQKSIIPSNSTSLPDTEQWINRIEIKSETSNRLYTIAQNRIGRYWACSCPAGKTRKNCKHLEKMGLPSGHTPFEPSVAQSKKNEFLGNYKTYDGPKGNPQEWAKALNNVVGPKENEGERIILFDDDEE